MTKESKIMYVTIILGIVVVLSTAIYLFNTLPSESDCLAAVKLDYNIKNPECLGSWNSYTGDCECWENICKENTCETGNKKVRFIIK